MDILTLNGDFKHSPLLETIARIHGFFTRHQVPYTIVGGMAVIRNGGYRTTHDIDILTTHQAWDSLCIRADNDFQLHADSMLDLRNNITIDVLFSGDDWKMVFPLPEPAAVSEYDLQFRANFLTLAQTIQWKLAVYLEKRAHDGIELAAKDLSDVVLLIQNNAAQIDTSFADNYHPVIRKEFKRICKKIHKRQNQ